MTDKRAQAKATLPATFWPTFDLLIEDYQEAAAAHVANGQRWINYNIVAERVRAGWSKNASR
jgi:hypothetical protein